MNVATWNQILDLCRQATGTVNDLIFVGGEKLLFYKHGILDRSDIEISQEFFDGFLAVLNEGQPFTHDLDRSYATNGERFRINVMKQRGKLKMVARLLPKEIMPFDKTGLPDLTREYLSGLVNGLVLFTGATGSGKSTSVASYLNHMVMRIPGHFVTLEDPIENFIGEGTGFEYRISQREVGHDVASWDEGLKSVLRQAPKVIFIGEVRDRSSADKAIEAASTGHLVVSTMHTASAAEAIDRILKFYKSDELPYILASLAESLRGVLCQRLEQKTDNKGRIALYEVCICQGPIKNMIRDGKVADIRGLMDTGRRHGHMTFDHAYRNAERQGQIPVVANRFGSNNP
jgi:twitching motility protein PilT